jgi:hypothetical protein
MSGWIIMTLLAVFVLTKSAAARRPKPVPVPVEVISRRRR